MSTTEHNNELENEPLIEKPKDEIEKEEVIQNNAKSGFENCCKVFTTILLAIIVLLLMLFLNLLLSIIFIYYKKNFKECQAVMYEKVNNILYIYLVLLIIYIAVIILGIIYEIAKIQNKKNVMTIINILNIILRVVRRILAIILLIVVQVYYNKSKSWKNCGNFKPWSVFWLVLNYIGLILLILYGFCFGLGIAYISGVSTNIDLSAKATGTDKSE